MAADQLKNRNVAGVVLCGGKSTRMGSPKAWLEIGDESMLKRVTRILSTVVQPIVVVSAQDQPLPAIPESIRRVCDQVPDAGPLSG